jgi:hypothetical protein
MRRLAPAFRFTVQERENPALAPTAGEDEVESRTPMEIVSGGKWGYIGPLPKGKMKIPDYCFRWSFRF